MTINSFNKSKLDWVTTTGCFIDFDQGNETIILESILTTIMISVILRGRSVSSDNWLQLKIEPP